MKKPPTRERHAEQATRKPRLARGCLTRQQKLDGDVPDAVAHWIVEFHDEFDDRDLTPLEVAQRAYAAMPHGGHCCVVTHVRSGLQWSICLARQEVVDAHISAAARPRWSPAGCWRAEAFSL